MINEGLKLNLPKYRVRMFYLYYFIFYQTFELSRFLLKVSIYTVKISNIHIIYVCIILYICKCI